MAQDKDYQSRGLQTLPPDPEERLERKEWFMASRLGTDGNPQRGQIGKASAQRRKAERAQFELRRKRRSAGGERAGTGGPPPLPAGGPGTLNWTPLGPSVVAHGQAFPNVAVSGRID